MLNKSRITIEGLIEEALPGLLFRVKIKNRENGEERTILAHPAGKMKLNHIRIIPGDRVLLEMPNPNDNRGRITRRL